MLSRREFLQVAGATATITGLAGSGSWARLAAQQRLTQSDLLAFQPLGNVTLLHFTDLHAQLVPIWFREPPINVGVGDARGQPPHLTNQAFLEAYNLKPGSVEAYALTADDFVALARSYGRVGGVDRMATLVNAIRAERPDNTLLLDGGDTWQGSYTSLVTRGADMVEVMNVLKPDAMTAHWEFTYGQERVKELLEKVEFPFLCQNVADTTWNEPVFESTAYFERGGVKVAVIGQAFPYTPLSNPGWLIPDWTFGLKEELIQERVEEARRAGAGLVVLLSHNGFDVDRKLASRVSGIDVLLTGHTHDALPAVVQVGKTLLVASGSHGKFLSRLDLDVSDGRVKDYRFQLIPVLSDVIQPDPAVAAAIEKVRAPHREKFGQVLGRTESLLYRRSNINGTFDDLILQALLEDRGTDFAVSPGFRWGPALMPGQEITLEDVYSMTAITYPGVFVNRITGTEIRDAFERVADDLYNPDPYYQQGGDMVRVGGIGFDLSPYKPRGQRISNLRMLRTGEPVDANHTYTVAGWANVFTNVKGPPIWDVVASYIQRHGTITLEPNQAIRVINV